MDSYTIAKWGIPHPLFSLWISCGDMLVRGYGDSMGNGAIGPGKFNEHVTGKRKQKIGPKWRNILSTPNRNKETGEAFLARSLACSSHYAMCSITLALQIMPAG
jgi:hypothetical protein